MCTFRKSLHTFQVHNIAIILSLLWNFLPHTHGQHSALPNECERGVKRHHPSQANVYQVFTRQDYQKQWLDYQCPEYTIFDPRKCQCVESQWTEPQEQLQPREKSQKIQRRPDPPTKSQTFEESKDVRKEEPITRKEYQPRPKSNWPPQQQQQQTEDYQGGQVYEEKQDRNKYADNTVEGGKPKPEADCYLHRPTDHPSLFERWSDGQWVQEDCNWPFYTGLVWNQGACRCEWGPNRTVAMPIVENSIPASCLMMLKVNFDGGSIKDEGRHIWLNIRNKESAHVESDSTAVGGKCGSFRGSSIAVPYFKSNVLGSTFHIGFMFKLCPGDPDTDIPLVHNDCIESGHDGPGIMVTYQAWKKQITLSMRTVNSDVLVSEYCLIGNAQNQWAKVDIRYGDSYMEVLANDEPCIQSSKYYGPVATNNCPLTLLGEAFCGKLDEVIVTRGCTDAHAVS